MLVFWLKRRVDLQANNISEEHAGTRWPWPIWRFCICTRLEAGETANKRSRLCRNVWTWHTTNLSVVKYQLIVRQCLSNGGPRIPGGPRDCLIVLFSSNEKACEMKYFWNKGKYDIVYFKYFTKYVYLFRIHIINSGTWLYLLSFFVCVTTFHKWEPELLGLARRFLWHSFP
jgi:hypothetical protein